MVQRFRIQGSAEPPAKKTAGQIEKETGVSYERPRSIVAYTFCPKYYIYR
jgi:hypothetical protein